MSKVPTFTLIAPQVHVEPIAFGDPRDVRWPQLAKLAGRGQITRLRVNEDDCSTLCPWQVFLLRALSLDEWAPAHASAPVTRLGEAARVPEGYWMHAEPVHLAAQLDRLTLLPLRHDAQPPAHECDELRATIDSHLTADGLHLHDARRGAWFLQADTRISVDTVCPDAVSDDDLDRALPQGVDAGRMRRTMTEIQMLWHDHPVNDARARRGLPAVNAVWLWGGGSIENVAARALCAGFGDDSYLKGLYRLYSASSGPTPEHADAMLAAAVGSAVCVDHALTIDAIEARWIAPLMRALYAGRLASVALVLGDWVIAADRLALLRFWRRPSPPAQWVA